MSALLLAVLLLWGIVDEGEDYIRLVSYSDRAQQCYVYHADGDIDSVFLLPNGRSYAIYKHTVTDIVCY